VECPVGEFLLTARITYTLSGFRLTAWVGPVRTGLSRKLALWSNRLGSGPVGSLGWPIDLSSILYCKALIIAQVSTWSSAILPPSSIRLSSGPVGSPGRPIGPSSILYCKTLIIALVSTWSSTILLRQYYWSCFLWSP